MSDNPFAEPDDNERTVIRPTPGSRPHAGAPATPEPSAAAAAATPREGAESLSFGATPLAAAAAPLLQLLARLRNTATMPDPAALRGRAIAEMRAFEQRCRAASVPAEQLRAAHYALCASLDDVALSTPWGASSVWNAQSLVSTFHQEVQSGERFYDLLTQVCQHPGRFLPVIELMYLCLSLGFAGRYRLSPRGPAEIERLREETYALILRQRPAAEREISPRWRGVNAPYRPARITVPPWVAGSAVAALLGAFFVWSLLSLNAASDRLFERMAAAPPQRMPAIVRTALAQPAPPPAPMPERLDTFLKPEIDQGLVSVLGTHAVPIVRIRNEGLFASGSAVVQPGFVHLLERIGEALKTEKGPVQVIGYTDNQPIHTVQFPSNFELSTARAKAARAIIVRALGDPARVTAEGRADADPIASNATPQGRAENRRIEVVLRRQDGTP